MVNENKERAMLAKPLFSAVVPIYNIEEFLPKCIDSLCSQSITNFEIILVDDGSKDNCGRICDEYAQKCDNIKVVHKGNEGLVAARQTGVEHATGEYIACIDGDDWVSNDYFRKFKDVIEEYHPDVVCCSYFDALPDSNVAAMHKNREGYYSRADLESEVFPTLLCGEDGKSFSSNLWAKVFRKEIYQQQQLVSVKVSMGEDEACVKPTIFHSNSMYIFNEPLYYYRQNENSISRSRRTFSWDGPEIRAKHLSRQLNLNEFDLQDQLYRSIVMSVFTVAVSQFNSDKPRKEICREINDNLANPLYDNAIKHCKFKRYAKGSFRLYVLKYRMYFLMEWFNNRKR